MRSGTRRRILLFILIVCIFLVIPSAPGVNPDWLPQDVFSCSSSARQHHKNIAPPPEPDRRALTTLWGGLWLSFTSHGTAPAHLEKPIRHGENEPVEEVRELVTLTDSEAQATRDSHAAVVDEIPPYPSHIFKGAGIVILAGGPFSEYAATSLGMLRELGSKLPVELWVIAADEELEGWCAELYMEGIACRRLSDYVDIGVLQHPYQYKVLTMLLSAFEEVLFLDADNIPLKNPDDLFQAEVYLRTGVILWPDYWHSVASAWTSYVVGKTPTKAHLYQDVKTIESGQIMWDKRRHWRSLVLAAYYNILGPNFYYTLISANYAGWGDKDTFPWALRALNEDYHQVPHDIMTIFQVPNSKFPNITGIAMAQADPRIHSTNTPMFLHGNIIKWSMRGFLCVDCPNLWVDVAASGERKTDSPSHQTNVESHVYENLHNSQRIFRDDELAAAGLDPEPLIWKVMEHTACRSKAWGNKQVCDLARKHMKATFGFDFRPTRIASATGFGQDMCIIDPPGIGHASPGHTPGTGAGFA